MIQAMGSSLKVLELNIIEPCESVFYSPTLGTTNVGSSRKRQEMFSVLSFRMSPNRGKHSDEHRFVLVNHTSLVEDPKC